MGGTRSGDLEACRRLGAFRDFDLRAEGERFLRAELSDAEGRLRFRFCTERERLASTGRRLDRLRASRRLPDLLRAFRREGLRLRERLRAIAKCTPPTW